MKHLQLFQVFPAIPDTLSFLDELSRNLWWSWHHDAKELFRRIDPKLWRDSGQNPIVFSTLVPASRLKELTVDESFLAHQKRIKDVYESSVLSKPKISGSPIEPGGTIAYISMEFGIHESLPLFAGGLGVLAGDHLKAASDLSIPVTGISLLYRRGYFRQYLSIDGMQQEEYPETDLYTFPIERAHDSGGRELYISIKGPNGEIRAQVWKIMIGRIPLLLLDTNLPENAPEVREITANLYPADQGKRLAQEALLGIGGVQALASMNIFPTVVHMNEGHSAFSGLERLAQIIVRFNTDLKTALEIAPRSSVFTTHTPVVAGHDVFPADMVRPYIAPLTEKLGISEKDILSLGRPYWKDADNQFSMFVLGLRMSQFCNGVSRLHGSVARKMWAHIWPDRPVDEIPITHVTNGAHVPSWISYELSALFDRYLGPGWSQHPWNPAIMNRIDGIYDEELWRTHEMNRSRLIRICRELMIKQYERRNAPTTIINDIESVLDQDALTIVFARRFATYKRSHLLFMDPERLESILTSETHPVQIIFAGKAHPKDQEAKDLIKKIVAFARKPSIRHRLVFLEDYDIGIARTLIQGADVWLNTPRRPFEACGTSGIKAAINGAVNVSILDGWWCEGYSEERGWKIGKGEEFLDPDYQDSVESQALYNVLTEEVIPCFYDRKNGAPPRLWVAKMKASLKMAMQHFCSHVMVSKYNARFYTPSAKRMTELVSGDLAEAKALALQRTRLLSLWKFIKLERPARQKAGPFRIGDTFNVTSEVFLGEITPDEVEIQLYFGKMKTVDSLTTGSYVTMKPERDLGNGRYVYACDVECDISGRFGFTARAIPQGDDWIKNTPELMTWA